MRKATAALALLLGAYFALPSPQALACGDKLLSIARGIRLNQTYKARHPASILLYVGDLEKAKRSRKERNRLVQLSILYMSLKQAGHELEVAQNPEELNQAASAGNFDFVMADMGDLDTIAEEIDDPSKGELLPVLFKPKKKAFVAAQAMFKLVLKTPATSVDHLEAIDDAMASVATGG